MKNRVVKIGSFWAVVISLLMISSATAINVVQSNTTTTQKKDVYVEPNICLTKKYLPVLKRSEKQLQDPEYKKIVQQIVSLLEKNGKVTSDDVKNIVDSSNADIKAVYALGRINGGGTGLAWCFPFFFLKEFPFLGLFTFPLPTLIMQWEISNNGHALNAGVYVKPLLKNHFYDETNHNGGTAIGYIGFVMAYTIIERPGYIVNSFFIWGAFILLFID